jgi:hypothetical protein
MTLWADADWWMVRDGLFSLLSPEDVRLSVSSPRIDSSGGKVERQLSEASPKPSLGRRGHLTGSEAMTGPNGAKAETEISL